MTDKVGQMTKAELEKMIATVVEMAVEQKLFEILGDPDEGLAIREAVCDRLLHQRQGVAAGERGSPLEDVTQKLGLE